LWLANYIPSVSAQQMDFYFDNATVGQFLGYGESFVITTDCNNGTDHWLGLGPSTLGQQLSNSLLNVPTMPCGKLYAFFAYRAPNQAPFERYSVGYLLVEGNVGFGWFSGFMFNGIYRGNNVSGKSCDYQDNTGPAQCTRNPDQGRTNVVAQVGTWNEMKMRMSSTYSNPTTITTNTNGAGTVVLFDVYVEGLVGQCAVWIYYGDNLNQAQFPIVGGVSAASSSAPLVSSSSAGSQTSAAVSLHACVLWSLVLGLALGLAL